MRWKPKGITVAGGNGSGSELHQLCNPQGLYVDDNQTVYIADENNHRIVGWKRYVTSGYLVAGLSKGKRADQFNDPRYVIGNKQADGILISDTYNARVMKWPYENGSIGQVVILDVKCSGLVMDDKGFLYVTNISKHEVRRYQKGETNGTVVAGGNGNGSGLNQLSYPTYVFVDKDRSVYVSDESNHRVMKWVEGAKEGIIVAGGNSYGYGLTQLYNPQGIAVDEWGTVYVADMHNHRIMRWPKGASQGNIIAGGNNKGEQANQLNSPKGLSFDRQGNLYVVDSGNSRVQKFDINPSSYS
jgi:sugar lactone lactonase YvrE